MKTEYTSGTAQTIANALRVAARQYKQDAETMRQCDITKNITDSLVEGFNDQEKEAYEMASLFSDCDGFAIEFEDSQETDYPYIRLWCRYYGFNMAELQSRLNRARKEKIPSTAVYIFGGDWQYLNDIVKPHLIELLKLSNS